LNRVVGEGPIELSLLATQLAAGGKQGRARVTLRVARDSFSNHEGNLLLVITNEDGEVAHQQNLQIPSDKSEPLFEPTVEFMLQNGNYQVRASASTVDGSRTGIVLGHLTIEKPTTNLWMSPPVILGGTFRNGPQALQPTLERTFRIGQPIVAQFQMSGPAVAHRKVNPTAYLVDVAGNIVREGAIAFEVLSDSKRASARVVVQTEGLETGSFALVTELRESAKSIPVRYSISLLTEQ
jgi:hypothetical protein